MPVRRVLHDTPDLQVQELPAGGFAIKNKGELIVEKEQRLEAHVAWLESEVARLQAQIEDFCLRGGEPVGVETRSLNHPHGIPIGKGDTLNIEYKSHKLRYVHVDAAPCIIDSVHIFRCGEANYVGVFRKRDLSPLEQRLFSDQVSAKYDIEVDRG